MKILIVCQYYHPKNFSITRIAEGLKKRGFDVDVLTGKPDIGGGIIDPKYKDISLEEINGVNVHRVDISPCRNSTFSLITNYLSFWKNSRKWVKKCKENYEFVYSYSLSPVTILSAANLYKKLHHVPHITHILDLWPESVVATHHVMKYSPMYFYYYVLSKKMYKGADKIVVGSPSYEEYFRKVLKIKKTPIEFIPQPSLLEKDDVKPYVYKQNFNLLYCGNVNKLQLCHFFVPTFEKLKDKDVTLHIVGNGRYLAKLVKDIDSHGLHDKIIVHGPKGSNESAAYVTGADACIVPLCDKTYVGKTIPAKEIMAMAFAKPIVAILNGDGRKVLEDAKGAVFADQTPESLANSISELLNMSKEEIKKLGVNNFNYYTEHFSLDLVLDKLSLLFVK